MIHSVKENCDNCKHAYIMTDTMCFGCQHPKRRYSCLVKTLLNCPDFEAGDPCYMGEDKAKDGCLLPHIQKPNNPEQTKQTDTRTSPDGHFDGDTLKYHGERDKMYTDMDSEGWSMKDGYAYYTKCCFWEDCKKNPETVLQSCIDLYRAKNKEYQNTDDQFENFTKGAELNMCTREQALWGYCTKQIVSLASIIKTGKNREKISEKARDIIVYMAILEAMQ